MFGIWRYLSGPVLQCMPVRGYQQVSQEANVSAVDGPPGQPTTALEKKVPQTREERMRVLMEAQAKTEKRAVLLEDKVKDQRKVALEAKKLDTNPGIQTSPAHQRYVREYKKLKSLEQQLQVQHATGEKLKTAIDAVYVSESFAETAAALAAAKVQIQTQQTKTNPVDVADVTKELEELLGESHIMSETLAQPLADTNPMSESELESELGMFGAEELVQPEQVSLPPVPPLQSGSPSPGKPADVGPSKPPAVSTNTLAPPVSAPGGRQHVSFASPVTAPAKPSPLLASGRSKPSAAVSEEESFLRTLTKV